MATIPGINADIVKQFAPNPGRRPLLPELSEKAQIALMCRMLFHEGWNEHIAGHITYRLADGNILTNPWELAWDEVTAGDIVTINEKGEILDSDWNVTPALVAGGWPKRSNAWRIWGHEKAARGLGGVLGDRSR